MLNQLKRRLLGNSNIAVTPVKTGDGWLATTLPRSFNPAAVDVSPVRARAELTQRLGGRPLWKGYQDLEDYPYATSGDRTSEQVRTAEGIGAFYAWLAYGSNFRLDIPGLDTVGVARIESFTISRRIDVVRTGASVTLVGRQVQIPNLVVTVGASRAEDWRAWHRQMVITGDQTAERNGALVFMAPDFRSELSRIELRNVGIARLADADDAARVVATLYCEQMQLKFPPSP